MIGGCPKNQNQCAYSHGFNPNDPAHVTLSRVDALRSFAGQIRRPGLLHVENARLWKIRPSDLSDAMKASNPAFMATQPSTLLAAEATTPPVTSPASPNPSVPSPAPPSVDDATAAAFRTANSTGIGFMTWFNGLPEFDQLREIDRWASTQL
jgi:hypothetical protein